MNPSKAFTLIELMIVIAILAIIASIIIPNLVPRVEVGKTYRVKSTGQTVRVIAKDYNANPTMYYCRVVGSEAVLTEVRLVADELEITGGK